MSRPDLLIVIPVLNRPANAARVLDSVERATTVPNRVLFVCSLGDADEIAACRRLGQRAVADVFPLAPGPGDWARKVNYAYRGSDEPWMLLGADDLVFHDGWAEAALGLAEQTGAGVVGTNDLANPRVKRGSHSTHPLVSRRYADELGTIDGPGIVACEAYDHQYVDDEIVLTAQRRKEWAFAADSVVEHLHPYFGTADWDATYRKAVRSTRADRALFTSRRPRIRTAKAAA